VSPATERFSAPGTRGFNPLGIYVSFWTERSLNEPLHWSALRTVALHKCASRRRAINCSVLIADTPEIASVFRWNVTCMRLAVANRRAADRSRVLRQRRRRGRACDPRRGSGASDGRRNCCAIAELSQQHNYSDQVLHNSISPVWDTFSRRGPARDRPRRRGIMFSPTRLNADHFWHRDFSAAHRALSEVVFIW
jgi:hypothetical protein